MNRRVRIHVSGFVQGVFFRASTKQRAQRLGLTGFVRNCPDGRVEIVAEGSPEALAELIDWCGVGPSGASVQSVCTSSERCSNTFDAFTVQGF